MKKDDHVAPPYLRWAYRLRRRALASSIPSSISDICDAVIPNRGESSWADRRAVGGSNVSRSSLLYFVSQYILSDCVTGLVGRWPGVSTAQEAVDRGTNVLHTCWQKGIAYIPTCKWHGNAVAPVLTVEARGGSLQARGGR